MTCLENLLEKYFVALENGKFPDYTTIKSTLRALRSARDDNKLYDELKNRYRDSCQLLDKVFKTHISLANKKIRDPIEEMRRQDMEKNPDWFQYNPANPSKDEIKTTELISAVEVAHFLLVKVGCGNKGLKNFLNLDIQTGFSLAKLISPFTTDFKILEMYLLYAAEKNSKDELLNQIIDYLIIVISRGNSRETESIKKLILDNIDYKKVVLEIDFLLDFFKEDVILVGNQKTLFRSMSLAGLVCGNLDILEKKMKTKAFGAPRFAKDVGGKPFILHMIMELVERGAERKTDKTFHISNDKKLENSKIALALSVPILEYVVESGLLSGFKPAQLRSQVDSILANNDENINEFMVSFKKESPASYAKLMELLNRIRNLNNGKQITPAELVAPKESIKDENPAKPSKYEGQPSSTTQPADFSCLCTLI